MRRLLTLAISAGLAFSAQPAVALELDQLLPIGIAGFNAAPNVTILTRKHPQYDSLGIRWDGWEINPELSLGAGYDSNPSGIASASATLNATPSLLLHDTALGFGAYAAAQFQNYMQSPAQNTHGYTLALGEGLLLPHNSLVLALARLRTQETGFTLDNFSATRPVTLTGTEFRASDKYTTGMLTLTPEFTYATAITQSLANPASASLAATNIGGGLTFTFTPDAITSLVMRLHASNWRFSQPGQNANDYTALIGLSNDAEHLWSFRLLGGAAARRPSIGTSQVVPVLEAAASWMPTPLTSLDFSAAHEIEDPERLDAASYTLSEAKLSLAHELRRNIIITATASATQAKYFHNPLSETLLTSGVTLTWRLNRQFRLVTAYDFNDRQANLLRAANEHVVTFTLTWAP
ncbi:MAG: outer membrane beta-barrel protein [Acidocella sp.]|nr:outer membrane beta-barrel protein [Acidocella sp.]